MTAPERGGRQEAIEVLENLEILENLGRLGILEILEGLGVRALLDENLPLRRNPRSPIPRVPCA